MKKKNTFKEHPATTLWRAEFVLKSYEHLEPLFVNGRENPDLDPRFLNEEVFVLDNISEEIEKIKERIPGHTKKP